MPWKGRSGMKSKITVTKSFLPPMEEYVQKIEALWDSHWITNMGGYHKELEKELRNFLGVPQFSLMVNGHMALELAIQAMGFPEGGEVITTPFTFISTTHAIVRNKLVPVFCDIKLSDYTIDEECIEALITEKTVAILPVHVYGNICNVDKINEIAEKYNLKVIYDAAHAFGESYRRMGIGNFGDASVFSFHATKVFSTIEGGGIAFSEERFYNRLYNLKNFGIRSEELVVEVGANAKMNEFCAAMGLCNLKYVEDNIKERERRVARYRENLSSIQGLVLPGFDQEEVQYSYGYFPVLFSPEILGEGARDNVFAELRANNIFARKYFYPITADQACFKNKYKNEPLRRARYAGDNILSLPLYPDLPLEAVDSITSIIETCCRGTIEGHCSQPQKKFGGGGWNADRQGDYFDIFRIQSTGAGCISESFGV